MRSFLSTTTAGTTPHSSTPGGSLAHLASYTYFGAVRVGALAFMRGERTKWTACSGTGVHARPATRSRLRSVSLVRAEHRAWAAVGLRRGDRAPRPQPPCPIPVAPAQAPSTLRRAGRSRIRRTADAATYFYFPFTSRGAQPPPYPYPCSSLCTAAQAATCARR